MVSRDTATASPQLVETMASSVSAAPLQPLAYGSYLLAASAMSLLPQDVGDLLKDALNRIKVEVIAGHCAAVAPLGSGHTVAARHVVATSCA